MVRTLDCGIVMFPTSRDDGSSLAPDMLICFDELNPYRSEQQLNGENLSCGVT